MSPVASHPESGRPASGQGWFGSGDDGSNEDRWKQIADLPTPQARAEFISLHGELTQPEVVANLGALVPALAKSDPNKALAVAEAAVMIANRLGDALCIAQSLRAKANAHYALGENKTALEHHGRALRLFRSLRRTEEIARTLSSSIQPLILQGRYRRAFAAAREARRIFNKQKNRWRVARLDLNLGNIYDRQDRFAEALRCYKRAHHYLSVHKQDDPEGVAVALHNMAVMYVRLNEFRAAATVYEKARSFASAHQMPVLVGQADYNIAYQHYLRGDYSRAISMLRAARENCRIAGDEYHVALCHLDLSEIYLELNLIAEAAEAAEQAEISFDKLGIQYEKAKSIANLAAATSQQGNAARALELFLQARNIFVKEKNKVYPAVIDLQRATVLFEERRDEEARRLGTAALSALQRYRLTNKTIASRLLLARLDLRRNDGYRGDLDQRNVEENCVRAAQRQCAQAIKALASMDLPVLNCQAYSLQGKIQLAAQQPRRAYTSYRRARTYLDRLRNSIHVEELRISFMKDRVEIYEALVDLCLKRAHHTQAKAEIFEYIEQAKSRALFDFLSASRSHCWLPAQEQTEQAKKILQLREELNWFFHKTVTAQFKQASRHELNALRAESKRRERELLKLSREHVSDHLESADQLPPTLTVDQVRQYLPPGTVILEYFQVQRQMIVVLLDSDQLQIAPLGELSRTSRVLDLLQLHLSKLRIGSGHLGDLGGVLLSATKCHLQELYQLLIEPIRNLLKARQLIIAPHGMLHQLPFHALFDGERYLIDEFTMSYAPSASVYALCQQRKAPAGNRSLVLGVPDSAVPFVKNEVETVAACLPNPEVFMGPTATAERLRVLGTSCRFIHIATHGHFRLDNPMFSGIRLGDSYLSLYDLYQMRLPAELVTLSGCSTGLNVVAAGDELMGLSRGLIHAGAETSMLTLWDVQDQSSAQLMKLFYTDLAERGCKAASLQQAMQRLKLDFPHPYHWAPFILVGKA